MSQIAGLRLSEMGRLAWMDAPSENPASWPPELVRWRDQRILKRLRETTAFTISIDETSKAQHSTAPG